MSRYKRKEKDRVILLFLSDMHSGHKLGLLNPDTILPEEDESGNIHEQPVELTKTQEYLWRVYQNGLKEVKRFADKSPIYAWHNGDLTTGIGKYTSALVSTREADQYIIAYYNLLPLLEIKNVAELRLTYGTGWHVFGQGSSERVVSMWLQDKYKNKKVLSMYHNLMQVGDEWIDVSHHGPGQSSRVWLSGNIARFYLRDLMLKAMAKRDDVPSLVVRAHIHQRIDESLDIYGVKSRIIVTPAMSFMTDYARKVMRSMSNIENGMCAVEIVNGRMRELVWMVNEKDLRTRESI